MMFPPGARVTAWRYSAARGLPCDLGSLSAMGLAAARHARWAGIPPWRVPEGPPGAQLLVHTWPEAVYEYVTTAAPCPGCGDAPPSGPGLCPGCTTAWGGQPPSASYAAWRQEGLVPATRVVHCRREPYDVLIDRSTPLGNPFVIGRDGDRDQVIAAYGRYLAGRPDLLAMIPALRGKRLGCWCKPAACHGDTLARLADDPAAARILEIYAWLPG
jgi:hypothetical protein